MFNFTGQAKRRNVNLSTKVRSSKRDLILKAQQERERREQEQHDSRAAIVIQKHIRQYLVCKWLFSEQNQVLCEHRLIAAFGKRLLLFRFLDNILELLKVSKDYLRTYRGKLGNRQLCKLLGACTDELLIVPILDDLNMSYPVNEELVEGIIGLLHLLNSISAVTVTKICETLHKWQTKGLESYSRVFEIKSQDCKSFTTVTDFYKVISATNLCPAYISSSSQFFESLAFIYSQNLNNINWTACLAQSLLKLKYKPVNTILLPYVQTLFGTDFTSRLVELIETQEYSRVTIECLSSLVKNAQDEVQRGAILISLISKYEFLKNTYLKIQENRFTNENPENHAYLYLFLNMLELYLVIATDHELVQELSGFRIKDLVEFTSYLKDFVFDQLWNNGGQSVHTDAINELTARGLPLLQRIYLRDSRLHFCSTKEQPYFWESKDTEFCKLNIYKYMDEYERIYRETLENVDEASEELLSAEHILSKMRVSFVMKVQTRQFRKLEVLLTAPFFVPFQERVDLLYLLIALDKQRLNLNDDSLMNILAQWNHPGIGRQSATISREHVLQDAYNSFNSIGESLKAKLAVTFVNEFGPEAGIDGGGITKEFLTSVSEEAFRKNELQLFTENDRHEIYPSTVLESNDIKYYTFLGKIMGKCLYEHVLVDVAFADFFLKKLLNSSNGFKSTFDDLLSLDSTLYFSMVKLLSMSAQDIESLDIYFETVSDSNKKVVELIPNGSQVRVTKDNVLKYAMQLADYKLNKSLARQTSLFHRGLSVIIAPHWIRMFNSFELQMLVSGGGKDIDLNDLKRNTEYGGFGDQDKTIEDFWEILAEFTPKERLAFVKFVTSVPRAPLQGFKALNPKFGIRNAGTEIDRLPTASTCVNLLKLPDYQDKALLKSKLLYSINSGARFDLS